MDAKRSAAAVILAGTLVRLAFWLTIPVTGDAAFHYSIARYMAQTLSVPTFEYVTGPNPFWWPPLFHISSALLFRLTGVLTLAPLLFGVAGLVAFHRFCLEFYPERATTATAMLAFLPFHVYYSGIGYFETLLFLLSVAAFHFYYRFRRGGSGRDLGYAAFMCALSASTHYHGLVPLIAISAHLVLRDRRNAAAFIVVGLLLSSPWYVRNLVVFGNPIWPKLYGGYYPDDAAVQSVPLGMALSELARPGKWAALYLDFWLGAPNSGEDFWSNVQVGEARYPFFDIFALGWLALTVACTTMAALGLAGLRRRGGLLLPALVFAAALVPFVPNGLARMFVALVPFAVLSAAEGFDSLRLSRKHLALAVAAIAFMGGSYAYAYTYKKIRDPYLPFFEQMKERIPGSANVVMPFNVQDCVYYAERRCLRVGSAGGIPSPDARSLDPILSDYDVSFVCCSSLYWDAISRTDRLICGRFAAQKPFIDYSAPGVWGRCWQTP
jgi:hypothetical protein